ncbi:MAG TPA: 30S ribosomal protein S16 [Allosphingosinicella sp.]|jgi:small subunit ribosomal protein S16
MAGSPKGKKHGIRLAKGGKTKRNYGVTATGSGVFSAAFIKQIGSFNPLLEKGSRRIEIDPDRVRHWLSIAAQPSDRVQRFLDAADLAKRRARRRAGAQKDPGVVDAAGEHAPDDAGAMFEQLASEWLELERRRESFRARLRDEVSKGDEQLGAVHP